VLQSLLNICGDHPAENVIAFNCNKVIGVFFVPKNINNLLHQMFFSTVYVYKYLTKSNILVYR